MSSPMFRGRLCVHKEVYDHGGGQRVWRIDTSPVAFDSLDNLGLHEFVSLSRLNTLSKRLLFTLHPSVTGEDAKLATGICAPDFPGRTFTGKSTSAFHGAPRLDTQPVRYDFSRAGLAPAGFISFPGVWFPSAFLAHIISESHFFASCIIGFEFSLPDAFHRTTRWKMRRSPRSPLEDSRADGVATPAERRRSAYGVGVRARYRRWNTLREEPRDRRLCGIGPTAR
jgi:hypothetical protein